MKAVMDIEQIRSYLPHAYPMLLLDRILEYESGEYMVGLKNVTANEPQFPGHFPQQLIYPGVLTCEALFQLGALLGLKTLEDQGIIEIKDGQIPGVVLLTSIDHIRLKRQVVPGDQLIMRASLVQFRHRGNITFGAMEIEAKTEGEICVQGRYKAALSRPS
ncbi:MAG: 3-hydroxyacyl-ACP dehydratase FabZ [Gammaproteobacteria bacterium]